MQDARRYSIALCVLPVLFSGAALAEPQLHCLIEQAGENRALEFLPVSDPYGVKAIDIGSDFSFKAVMVGSASGIEYIRTYIYFRTPRRVVLLHSARFLAPQVNSAGSSLTGLNYVYSPGLERELRYECALSEARP